MAATWTLTYDGVTKTFAEWGLKGLQRSGASQAVGRVKFTQSGAAYDGTPLFAVDALVTISKDGEPWHVGPVTVVPRSGGARSESLDYEIADPWWYLEQLPYEQSIITGAGSTVTPTTRIALFAEVVEGAIVKGTAETMIASAFALAVSAGAAMQVAFLGDFGISPPIADMRDPTCAEVIRQVLRWVPDATGGWDYGTTPPTYRLSTRAAATVRTIDLADKASVNLIDITPRDDLRRDRIVIFYQITSTDDNETFVSFVVDEAGTGSPFRTLKATLPLSGPQIQRQKQYLETESIREDSTSWWQEHVPTLKDADELDISEGSVEPATEDGDSFDMVIVDGQVPGWLDDPDAPASGSMRVSAKAAYKRTTEEGGEIEFKDDPVSVTLSCTNLSSGLYSRVSSYTDGEAVPAGVAAALLAALGVLTYDGKIKIKQRECSFITRPGEVLNLAGGMADWLTARMQVQKVDEDVDAGQTLITFGPPKHLSPQDIIEMLRTLRGKAPVHNLDERATGIKDKGNDAKGGRTAANDNGATASANWHRVVAKNPSGSETLTLDAALGVKMVSGSGGFIDHQTANLRTLYQDSSGNSAEIKPTHIELLDADGNGVVLTPTGLVITRGENSTELTLNRLLMIAGGLSMSLTEEELELDDGENTAVIAAGSLTIEDGAATSELSPAHLLLENAGKTNSITEEQMVIAGDGDTAIYEASEVTLSDGDKTATLTTSSLTMLDGDYTATVSGEGGFTSNSSDGLAKLNAAGGVHLDDGSGGTVDIYTIADEVISLQDTDSCDVDEDGEPITKTAKFLRGEEHDA